MKRLNSLKYYWNKTLNNVQSLIIKVLNALSFLMIAFYFGYILHYSIVCYDMSRTIVGCIALCVMIHLNTSL